MATFRDAVEVWRGEHVESRHRAAIAIAEPSGKLQLAIGDVDAFVFPRSAIKPFQAVPLIESGAADDLSLGFQEIAVACASHNGESAHTGLVSDWLSRIALSTDDLGCGPQRPQDRATAEALVRQGLEPGRVHNNCSGKHTGMLTVAKHLGEPTSGYLDQDHPVQKRSRAVLSELCDGALLDPPGTDGCGVPTWPVALRNLATAAARLGVAGDKDGPRNRALHRVGQAMRAEPFLVAGTGRCCTAIMQAVPGVLAKTGAEGVYLLAVPEKQVGVALKVEDGATRAAQMLTANLLGRLGVLDSAAKGALDRFLNPVLRNFAGTKVGHLTLAPGWDEA